LALWGEGWDELEEFASAARGNVAHRDAFHEAVAGSIALIYCWPQRAAHPIDATGKPVIHRTGNDATQLIRDARKALAGSTRISIGKDQSLARVILDMLAQNK
jgi:hypothetical protein